MVKLLFYLHILLNLRKYSFFEMLIRADSTMTLLYIYFKVRNVLFYL